MSIYYSYMDCISHKMHEFSRTVLKLHPDIIALTEVKPINASCQIQLSELNISGFDVFSYKKKFLQVGTRDIYLCFT